MEYFLHFIVEPHKKKFINMVLLGILETHQEIINESVRILLRRKLKKQAKIWCRLAPNRAITKKPNETRMGKGKGTIKYWVHAVRPGQIVYELKGCKMQTALTAIKQAEKKLPVQISFLNKNRRWVL